MVDFIENGDNIEARGYTMHDYDKAEDVFHFINSRDGSMVPVKVEEVPLEFIEQEIERNKERWYNTNSKEIKNLLDRLLDAKNKKL